MTPFKPGMLCSCGNCEDAANRALGYVAKAITDGECTIFTGAVGIIIAAMSSEVMVKQIEGIMTDKGIPEFVVGALADAEMMDAMDSIAKQVKDWYGKHRESKVEPVLNDAIERYNKAYTEERNLPKGG